MKNFLQENLALVVAFTLPVLLILGVAMSFVISSWLLATDYDFVYATCVDNTNYYNRQCNDYLVDRFSVVDGRLVVSAVDPAQDAANNDRTLDRKTDPQARLFLHNTKSNESREITVAEAQALQFNELLTSPDGVTVTHHYERGVDLLFFYGGGSSYGYYLTKGDTRSQLNLVNADNRYSYRNNFQFIGWVLPGRN